MWNEGLKSLNPFRVGGGEGGGWITLLQLHCEWSTDLNFNLLSNICKQKYHKVAFPKNVYWMLYKLTKSFQDNILRIIHASNNLPKED